VHSSSGVDQLLLELPSWNAGTYLLIASKALLHVSTCFLFASHSTASLLKRALLISSAEEDITRSRYDGEFYVLQHVMNFEANHLL
jgi:hypothetical protein